MKGSDVIRVAPSVTPLALSDWKAAEHGDVLAGRGCKTRDSLLAQPLVLK